MPYLTVSGFGDNPVPPSPRSREQTAEWYAREKEHEAQWMGNLIGMLVYVADALNAEECDQSDPIACEYCNARWIEWENVFDALPAGVQQTVRATLHALGQWCPR